jgi:hypothetical protein
MGVKEIFLSMGVFRLRMATKSGFGKILGWDVINL